MVDQGTGVVDEREYYKGNSGEEYVAKVIEELVSSGFAFG